MDNPGFSIRLKLYGLSEFESHMVIRLKLTGNSIFALMAVKTLCILNKKISYSHNLIGPDLNRG